MKEQFHHHFLLSTVTGVAPTMSMIRQYLHQGGQGHYFYVILGASYQDELTYDRVLSQLAAQHPDCKFTLKLPGRRSARVGLRATYSRPSIRPPGNHRRRMSGKHPSATRLIAAKSIRPLPSITAPKADRAGRPCAASPVRRTGAENNRLGLRG